MTARRRDDVDYWLAPLPREKALRYARLASGRGAAVKYTRDGRAGRPVRYAGEGRMPQPHEPPMPVWRVIGVGDGPHAGRVLHESPGHRYADAAEAEQRIRIANMRDTGHPGALLYAYFPDGSRRAGQNMWFQRPVKRRDGTTGWVDIHDDPAGRSSREGARQWQAGHPKSVELAHRTYMLREAARLFDPAHYGTRHGPTNWFSAPRYDWMEPAVPEEHGRELHKFALHALDTMDPTALHAAADWAQERGHDHVAEHLRGMLARHAANHPGA
jgi:hypothetical protein